MKKKTTCSSPGQIAVSIPNHHGVNVADSSISDEPPIAVGILTAPPPSVAGGGSRRGLLGQAFRMRRDGGGSPDGSRRRATCVPLPWTSRWSCGHVLLATAVRDCSDAVTPATLLTAMEVKCSFLPSDV